MEVKFLQNGLDLGISNIESFLLKRIPTKMISISLRLIGWIQQCHYQVTLEE